MISRGKGDCFIPLTLVTPTPLPFTIPAEPFYQPFHLPHPASTVHPTPLLLNDRKDSRCCYFFVFCKYAYFLSQYILVNKTCPNYQSIVDIEAVRHLFNNVFVHRVNNAVSDSLRYSKTISKSILIRLIEMRRLISASTMAGKTKLLPLFIRI